MFKWFGLVLLDFEIRDFDVTCQKSEKRGCWNPVSMQISFP
jgi:hypothetical protein